MAKLRKGIYNEKNSVGSVYGFVNEAKKKLKSVFDCVFPSQGKGTLCPGAAEQGG